MVGKLKQSDESATPQDAQKLEAISGFVTDDVDDHQRLLNDRVRLGILSSLSVAAILSFGELKELLETSDGNLSTHARKLEDAGYLKCRKSFSGRTPRTDFTITARGRTAMQRYLKHMEALIKATST